MCEQEPMSEEMRDLITALCPRDFVTILGNLTSYRRAEAVIERHWRKTGKVLLIKEVRDQAEVGWKIAKAAAKMARNRTPKN